MSSFRPVFHSSDAASASASSPDDDFSRLSLEDEIVYRSVGIVAPAPPALAMPSLRSAERSSSWGEEEEEEIEGGCAPVPCVKKTLDELPAPSWSKPATQAVPSLPVAVTAQSLPPLAPCYVEPSAWTLHADPARVLDAVAAELRARTDVLATVDSRQWRVHCVLTPSATCADLVRFRVHLFRQAAAGQPGAVPAVLVECQRRSGSCVAFGEVVRTLREALLRKFEATAAAVAVAVPAASLQLTPLTDLTDLLAELGLDTAPTPGAPVAASASSSASRSLRTLLDMCGAASLSTARDGWALLAAEPLAGAGADDALVAALQTVFAADADAADLRVRVYAARVLLALARGGDEAMRAALVRRVAAAAAAVAFAVEQQQQQQQRSDEEGDAADDELLQRDLLSAISAALEELRAHGHESALRAALAAAAAAAAATAKSTQAAAATRAAFERTARTGAPLLTLAAAPRVLIY